MGKDGPSSVSSRRSSGEGKTGGRGVEVLGWRRGLEQVAQAGIASGHEVDGIGFEDHHDVAERAELVPEQEGDESDVDDCRQCENDHASRPAPQSRVSETDADRAENENDDDERNVEDEGADVLGDETGDGEDELHDEVEKPLQGVRDEHLEAVAEGLREGHVFKNVEG